MAKQNGTKTGIYRSKFEASMASELKDLKLKYENSKFEYIIPATKHTYTPDFQVSKDIFIETKGLFSSQDRQKALYIQQQHPNITVIFLFMNPNLKLGVRLGTCLEWCQKRNIPAFGKNDLESLRNFINTLKESK